MEFTTNPEAKMDTTENTENTEEQIQAELEIQAADDDIILEPLSWIRG